MQKLFILMCLSLILNACRESSSPAETEKAFKLIIGGKRGHSAGQFNRPRGICYDAGQKLIYVVDWDGRIQSFTTAGHEAEGQAVPEGRFRGSWIMPEVKKGKPEDLCLTSDGHILVADTHYSRIAKFDLKGNFVSSFGQYGRGNGEFIYPVGITIDEDDNIYVSEYGDNNRVQKFDKDGNFLISFGEFGSAEGQFQRPSGIAFGPDKLLYVTDGVNHRIQVYSKDGKLQKIIGKQGQALGEFTYPYDICFKNGYMYVLEFGNCRVQKLELSGKGLATFGSRGNKDGQFSSPWRFTAVEDHLFVSDTNNSRVVKIDF